MSTQEERCKRATLASMETILVECAGKQGQIEEIDDDVFAFLPEGVAEEQFGFSTNSPQTEAERQEAIESCMNSEWSREWAESVLGPDAPMEARSAARRRACEGLFS